MRPDRNQPFASVSGGAFCFVEDSACKAALIADAATRQCLVLLDETFVTVSGEQKLLMTKLSRFVEARALAHGEGTLRAGFQQLSRLADEHGTASVYRRLAEAGVDTHVYGHPDGSPEALDGLAVHGHETEELRWTWFVVYRVPDRPDLAAALVAERRSDLQWQWALPQQGDE